MSLRGTFYDIADAIRSKNLTGFFRPDEMPGKIALLDTDGAKRYGMIADSILANMDDDGNPIQQKDFVF